jgi:hypothetical protein
MTVVRLALPPPFGPHRATELHVSRNRTCKADCMFQSCEGVRSVPLEYRESRRAHRVRNIRISCRVQQWSTESPTGPGPRGWTSWNARAVAHAASGVRRSSRGNIGPDICKNTISVYPDVVQLQERFPARYTYILDTISASAISSYRAGQERVILKYRARYREF